MNAEKIQQLAMDYPHLFPQGADGITIFCGDGWFNIIYQLCGEIMSILHTLPQLPYMKIIQIKEKFGTLRFYTCGYHNAVVARLVGIAEDKSYNVCELTGEPGLLCQKGGWLRTLSEDKRNELGYTPVQTPRNNENFMDELMIDMISKR